MKEEQHVKYILPLTVNDMRRILDIIPKDRSEVNNDTLHMYIPSREKQVGWTGESALDVNLISHRRITFKYIRCENDWYIDNISNT